MNDRFDDIGSGCDNRGIFSAVLHDFTNELDLPEFFLLGAVSQESGNIHDGRVFKNIVLDSCIKLFVLMFL